MLDLHYTVVFLDGRRFCPCSTSILCRLVNAKAKTRVNEKALLLLPNAVNGKDVVSLIFWQDIIQTSLFPTFVVVFYQVYNNPNCPRLAATGFDHMNVKTLPLPWLLHEVYICLQKVQYQDKNTGGSVVFLVEAPCL